MSQAPHKAIPLKNLSVDKIKTYKDEETSLYTYLTNLCNAAATRTT